MKALVFYNARKSGVMYEADRLQRNIRNALELNGIKTSTKSLPNDYDVVHLVRPGDELFLQINREIPLIFSVLACENDSDAAVLDEKKSEMILSSRAVRSLAKADAIIVPSLFARNFLLNYKEIKAPVYIVSSGVNVSRFDYNKTIELAIFPRYLQISKPERLVVTLGDYGSLDGITSLIDIAGKCPDIQFYFFGKKRKWFSLPPSLRKSINSAPKNLKFNQLVPEDVYRSLMLNADILLVPNYETVGEINILDAMASKTQIIIRNKAIMNQELLNNETALVAEDTDGLIELINKYYDGSIESTIEKAYNVAKENSLTEIGITLKQIYTEVLSKKERKQ